MIIELNDDDPRLQNRIIESRELDEDGYEVLHLKCGHEVIAVIPGIARSGDHPCAECICDLVDEAKGVTNEQPAQE